MWHVASSGDMPYIEDGNRFVDRWMAIEPDVFKNGMRRLTAGVTIITTLADGERRGLTATAVCSVSVAPPTLLCCVNRQGSAHDAILASGRFAINVLTAADLALAERFGGAELGEARFSEGEWGTLETGAPILKSAFVGFDCRVVQTFDGATHSIFLGEVVAQSIGDGAEPLCYLGGSYGSFHDLEALLALR
jgi:flavin reductase (DIM6/NTAB) family NADH-FMN oxidoreductase RutF